MPTASGIIFAQFLSSNLSVHGTVSRKRKWHRQRPGWRKKSDVPPSFLLLKTIFLVLFSDIKTFSKLKKKNVIEKSIESLGPSKWRESSHPRVSTFILRSPFLSLSLPRKKIRSQLNFRFVFFLRFFCSKIRLTPHWSQATIDDHRRSATPR